MSKMLVAAGVLTVSLGALLLLRSSKEGPITRAAPEESAVSSAACRVGYLLLGVGFLVQAMGTYLP